jgi:hypothetical protein
MTRTRRQFVAGLLVLLIALLAGCGATPTPAATIAAPTPVIDAGATLATLLEGTGVEVPGRAPAPRPTQSPTSTPSHTPSLTSTATPTVAPTSTPTATPTPAPQHPLAIEFVRQQRYPGSQITIEEELEPGANYGRYIASYRSEGLKIFALLTVPLSRTAMAVPRTKPRASMPAT